jgi:hypothetical protein
VLAALGVAVLVLALALYAARKVIAREALVGWLRSHGVAATAEVGDIGLGAFKGRVIVGDPAAPDFVAGDAEVTYGLRGLSFEVRSVRLTRPVVRARLHDGVLSLGALDPLIAELRKRPPRPDAAKPAIAIDDGMLLLATDYGPVRLTADAAMADGKLTAVTATTAPAHLKGAGFDLTLGAGAVSLRTRGDRLDAVVDAPLSHAAFNGLTAENARLQLTGQGPYPDLIKRRGDGKVTVRASLTGGRVAMADQRLDGVRLTAAFDGAAAGWIDSLTLTGKADAELQAASGAAGSGRVGVVRALATAPDLRWSRRGGDTLSATPSLTMTARDLTAGQLRVPQAAASARGPMAFGKGGVSVAMRGNVSGRGVWTGLGAPLATDAPQIEAIKRAARGFAFEAPAISLAVSKGATRLSLSQPLRLTAAGGGKVLLTDRGDGAWGLTVAGGGLPDLAADVTRIDMAKDGATATGRLRAALSVGPVLGGTIDAAGVLKFAGGTTSFTASGCVPIRARRLEFGANDIEAMAGRLCPDGQPLFSMAGGAWKLHARADGVTAAAPFAQVRIEGGAGRVDASQAAGRLKVNAVIATARIVDTAPSTRFATLQVSGPATVVGDRASADLNFRTMAGGAIGQAQVRHDSRAGAGGVSISTGTLTFAEGGLQPLDLSPLASAVGTPATGQAAFTGRFDWTGDGVTSSGRLDVSRLDFQSPAGKVTGLSGQIAFTSLSPLIAAPGQVLRADAVDAFAALTGLSASLEIQQNALVITAGEATVGGGRVKVEKLTVPLTAGAAVEGALLFEGVQLHDLVEASPFGDKVDLDAVVSGRVPFESQEGKVRILGGDLHAIQPGRLSIDRSALDAVAAGGTAELPTGVATALDANDTFTDFAYQAMENLAFTTLDAGVATQADGRLGVLFHIIGEHDPPKHQEIRLSIFDLIGRKFLGRKLPLPSGTGVDLTLDTTLNLDDLLADYAEYQRLRNSAPVQAGERK